VISWLVEGAGDGEVDGAVLFGSAGYGVAFGAAGGGGALDSVKLFELGEVGADDLGDVSGPPVGREAEGAVLVAGHGDVVGAGAFDDHIGLEGLRSVASRDGVGLDGKGEFAAGGFESLLVAEFAANSCPV